MKEGASNPANLSGRVALITGGAGHIGSAIAVGLAEQGARVFLLDRASTEPDRVAHYLGGETLPIEGLPSDLEDEDRLRKTMAEFKNDVGQLDIMVHAAGLAGTSELDGWAVPFEEQSLCSWDRAMRVNLSSAFLICQTLYPLMASNDHGSIILISSIYGSVGPDMALYKGTAMENPVGYGASKGGLLQLMRYLSTLLAPKIRVNALSPGGVERGQPQAFIDRYSERTPLGRMASERDLVGPAVFLASDMSAYITGHDLKVDGGWSAW